MPNTNPDNTSPIMNVPQVCAYLGVGRDLLYELAARDEIPHFRPGAYISGQRAPKRNGGNPKSAEGHPVARPGADSDCYRNFVSDTQDVYRRTLSKERVLRVKGVVYKGTAGGYLEFGRRELLKAALTGQSLKKDATRIQHRLDKAAAQDRTKRIVTKFQRGGIA